MDAVKRWAVITLASAGGLTAAVGHALATWPGRMESSKTLSSSDAEWVSMASTFETCVILFAFTYLTGRLWALLIGPKGWAEEIRLRSTWHLRILGAFSVLLALLRAWFVGKRGWRPIDDLVAIGFIVAMAGLVVVFQLGPRGKDRAA